MSSHCLTMKNNAMLENRQNIKIILLKLHDVRSSTGAALEQHETHAHRQLDAADTFDLLTDAPLLEHHLTNSRERVGPSLYRSALEFITTFSPHDASDKIVQLRSSCGQALFDKCKMTTSIFSGYNRKDPPQFYHQLRPVSAVTASCTPMRSRTAQAACDRVPIHAVFSCRLKRKGIACANKNYNSIYKSTMPK
ncbi:uncharacterized protein BJ212DRAFT_1296071 [Suillus subaureus]|uniref:Uncharacterized protein n=1 Tax=Suillus subaureus TaxID=48587 RepID=A0A9P7EJ36_9AGAM|nr:uncharacterized protein BJ212DRAFT_1296071 [Suillus subaureus]KAG1823442.1 hypothetical protein BJ212DRAFT_1296071 [Suillus subaureus]